MNDTEPQAANSPGVEAHLAIHGGLTYLHIPAVDVQQSATFYEQAFGWETELRSAHRATFTDGTGRLIGAWVTDLAISREPGLLPYIYVNDINAVVQKIEALGGQIIKAPYPEGDLWVATFRDPAGNVIGLWQAEA